MADVVAEAGGDEEGGEDVGCGGGRGAVGHFLGGVVGVLLG